jgi:transposase
VTQAKCATEGTWPSERNLQTVMRWIHRYNESGPEVLIYRRSGGRPLCGKIERTLDAVIREAMAAASAPLTPDPPVTAPVRWTLKRLVAWIGVQFQRVCGRETMRRALRRFLKLSWKKAKTLLGRADTERLEAFVEQIQTMLKGARPSTRISSCLWMNEAPIWMRTSAMASRCAASGCGSVPVRRNYRRRFPSKACTDSAADQRPSLSGR